MEKVRVAKKFSFDAAHFLPGYLGKCANLHGHRWEVELAIEGPVDSATGMVVDFKWLKSALEDILEKFDHNLLNDILFNPTAENLAIYVRNSVNISRIQGSNEAIRIAWVRVWESPDSYVEVLDE